MDPGTGVAPGAKGVGARVELGGWEPVTWPVDDGKLHLGFLQQGLAKSVIRVQYGGRLTHRGHLKK